MSTNMRDETKKQWTTANMDREAINIGCLLRIADACELMAKNHQGLLNDVQYYKTRADDLRAEITRLNNRNAALRGHLNKHKKHTQGGKR